jgi:hypothetical protein
LGKSDHANIVRFDPRPDWNIIGGDYDGYSDRIGVRGCKKPQPIVDGEADEQADRERQAPDHQQTASVHSSPIETATDLFANW